MVENQVGFRLIIQSNAPKVIARATNGSMPADVRRMRTSSSVPPSLSWRRDSPYRRHATIAMQPATAADAQLAAAALGLRLTPSITACIT